MGRRFLGEWGRDFKIPDPIRVLWWHLGGLVSELECTEKGCLENLGENMELIDQVHNFGIRASKEN